MMSDLAARSFRRMLSGADDGVPAWLTALERPGDAGWFGPGSTIWQVHGSLSTLVGGVRALLLQTVHPLALAGVVQHSDFRADPLGRLQRTGQFLAMTVYGSTDDAQRAVRIVRRVHEPVVGTTATGRPYSANDPHLLSWVHLGLTDSMLSAYLALESTPVDGNRYVAEMAVIADALGVPDPPRTRAELAEQLRAFRPELTADGDTWRTAGFLLAPPLPLVAQPAYQLVAGTAVDLLPVWCRRMLGLWRRPAPLRATNRAATGALFAGLRSVLGPTPPGERAALVRIAGAA